MHFYYITFRSVTYAQRGEKILQEEGIRCTLLRTPRWMEEQGCGYCMRLWTKETKQALHLLRKNQIPYKKIYIQGRDGQLEDWKE